MVKSLIKEIIIILLLLLAVILALGVLFYDYIPNNKTVPTVQTYKTSESVERELEENVSEGESVITTYEVTKEDLRDLQRTDAYTAGKANPFSTYEEPVINTEDVNSITNVGSVQGTVNTNNGGTFYKNTATK